jgi:hypothetical protein
MLHRIMLDDIGATWKSEYSVLRIRSLCRGFSTQTAAARETKKAVV